MSGTSAEEAEAVPPPTAATASATADTDCNAPLNAVAAADPDAALPAEEDNAEFATNLLVVSEEEEATMLGGTSTAEPERLPPATNTASVSAVGDGNAPPNNNNAAAAADDPTDGGAGDVDNAPPNNSTTATADALAECDLPYNHTAAADLLPPADADFDSPSKYRTSAAPLPPPSLAEVLISPSKTVGTAVDGQGMWRSWTRVFAKPESACLDLLDNCFDAALRAGFEGRVTMTSHLPTQLSIQNNSLTPIKRLDDALTVYKSSKNFNNNNHNSQEHKDSIGENGVGLKQGCATLSDCSLVLTRNLRTVEIGLIAKGLQTSAGVCLPSFSFEVFGDADTVAANMRGHIDIWLSNNPVFLSVLAQAFGSSLDVSQQVVQFAENLFKNQWDKEDHVFLLVLCKLKKSAEVPHQLIESVSPAKVFLRDIKAMLPEYYVNLPAQGSFDFVIDQERIDFSFWQHRLVELTKFEVHIPTDVPFEDLPEADWDQASDQGGKYKLSIYCGFDAKRVDHDMRWKRGTSTCHLYIYSCQAGRLIKKEVDARYVLGLSTSGVDYTQGLTVIINDIAGMLPLTPTKDGIAWSERTNGEIHHRNLMAWTGAVAQTFWTQHKNRFGGKGGNNVKEMMKKTIRSFAEEDIPMESVPTATGKNMEDAEFTKCEGIKWIRVQANFDNRWKIRKSAKQFRCSKGPDTLFAFDSERIRRIKDGRKPPKRKVITANNNNNNIEGPNNNKRESIGSDCTAKDELEGPAADQVPWPEIPGHDITRVCQGVLAFLRDRDKEDLFEVPVLETLPEIKDKYLELVKTPMDFRTIEEQRMLGYTSIRQFQDDLMRCFQNCILYNGMTSWYGKIAQQMIDWLDDAFDSTDVKQVTMGVLSFLRDLDERELFEIPVLEQLPEIKEDYLLIVTDPMDFRTIEEERVNSYKTFDDLRQDLVLIFQNCVKFNGATSPFGMIAQQMQDSLDEAFEYVTMGRKKRRKNRVNYDEIVNQYNSLPSETVQPKPTTARKKLTYTQLEKKLRDTEKQVRELKERIRQLEGGKSGGAGGGGTKRGPRGPYKSRKKQPTYIPPADEDTSEERRGRGRPRKTPTATGDNPHQPEQEYLLDVAVPEGVGSMDIPPAGNTTSARRAAPTSRKRKPEDGPYPIGTRILKTFPGHGTFEGRVTAFDGELYTIHYPEDGDEEEFDDDGFNGVEIVYVAPPSEASHKRSKSSSSASSYAP